MKYYVVADIHGFFDAFHAALAEQGFFSDPEPHKLIVCGDLFDRGPQALQVQEFLLDLLARDEVILIRGNHEDLALDLLNRWPYGSYWQPHHHSNGTVDTVLQLTQSTQEALYRTPDSVCRAFLHSPYIQTLIPAMLDYYETAHYIFVHGWLPAPAAFPGLQEGASALQTDWRAASAKDWQSARWRNGMEAAHSGATEPGKTIVCGHWHCSFGHAHYEGRGGEFDHDPDFTPYYGPGIIALDACTARSGRVNCIVLDDQRRLQ